MDINALYQQAIVYYQSGQLQAAQDVCRQLLAALPRNPDVLNFAGIVENQMGQYKSAIKFLRQAVKVNGKNASYHGNLALALQNSGELREAAVEYRRALVIDPNLAEAHMNLGNILKDQGDLEGAMERLQHALGLQPENAAVHYNLGSLLYKQGKGDEALASFDRALALQPFLAQAHSNRGLVLKDQGRYEAAVAAYQSALSIDPNSAEVYNNLGIALMELQHYDDAIAQFEKSLSLRPDNAETLYNLGFTYRAHKKIAKAIEIYTKCLSIDPDNAYAITELLHQRHHACLWGEETDRLEKQVMDLVRRKRKGVSPFIFLSLPSSAAEQLICAQTFGHTLAGSIPRVFSHTPGRRAEGKIRIGYLSADYHQHATAYLMAELFERHDRQRFELTAYSYGPDDKSDMRTRLEKAFDHFVDIRMLPHRAAAQRIYDDGIDILVDLKGYTGEGRLQIAAHRPAPVQVSYLGYPGTLGVDFMDYVIGDAFITPLADQPFYSEKIVQLPDCYQPNDTQRHIAPEVPGRADCGLPAAGFVFCSFNSSYKITPAIFDIWMRLLHKTPDSVLWLFESNELVKENLRREAQARGVDPERLVFAPGMLLDKHLARHALADLFLDTLPVNAHTTASDALWAGLPVLTCAGGAFAGRVAGSLLHAAGLPDLVTSSLQEYESKALSLAEDPARLRAIREKLLATKRETPLFDIGRFVTHIENAYQEMHARWQSGQPPAPVSVKA